MNNTCRRLSVLLKYCFIATFACAGFGRATAAADEGIPADPPLRWWKGNIHTHSLWSDGNDFPEMIAQWYRTHGYNFLALSDHNVLSEGIRWMKHVEIVRRGGRDALDKYRKQFSDHWVETRVDPATSQLEVRLKPLNEFRALVEERGKFIMISGEEISDRVDRRPVHLNATNIKEVIHPLGGQTVRQAIENNLRAVQQQAERTGREILLHVNHPNFGLAVTAEDLAAVLAERFFEVYNGHPAVNHLGDENHPGVERLWDIANTIRLGQLSAPPLYGVATDDSHKYHGQPGSRPGRGWIMVRSRFLTPEHLIRAVKQGQFYASSGVVLDDVQFDASSGQLKLKIQAEANVRYVTQFIGTLVDYDSTTAPRALAGDRPPAAARKYSADIGRVLASNEGLQPTYTLSGRELYVRAVVTSSRQHPDPSFEDQFQQAWTQPVGWQEHLHATAATH